MNKLNEIKAKYPLAVEAMKVTTFQINARQDITLVESANGAIGIEVMTSECPPKQLVQDQLGKMLAELLNLIAKP